MKKTKNSNRGTALERSVGKLLGWRGECGGEGVYVGEGGGGA